MQNCDEVILVFVLFYPENKADYFPIISRLWLAALLITSFSDNLVNFSFTHSAAQTDDFVGDLLGGKYFELTSLISALKQRVSMQMIFIQEEVGVAHRSIF